MSKQQSGFRKVLPQATSYAMSLRGNSPCTNSAEQYQLVASYCAATHTKVLQPPSEAQAAPELGEEDRRFG